MPLIKLNIHQIKVIVSILKTMVLVQQTFGMPLALSTVGQVDILQILVPVKAAWLVQGSMATIGLPVLTLRGGGAASTSIRAPWARATPFLAPTVSRLALSQNNNSIDLIHSTI